MLLAMLKEQGKEGEETQDPNTDEERLGYPQSVVEVWVLGNGLGQRGL